MLPENEIGDETFSAVKWLAAHWSEVGPWIAIGLGVGIGVVLPVIGTPIAAGETLPKWLGILIAVIGPLLVTIAWIGVYLARRSYLKQAEKRRREIRAEKHDELIGAHESEVKTINAHLDEYRHSANSLRTELEAVRLEFAGTRTALAKHAAEARTERELRLEADENLMKSFRKEQDLIDELTAFKRQREMSAIEDNAWSANPFKFLNVAPCNCSINFSCRYISLRINIDNRYTKSRPVWISANVAIYMDGKNSPLFTIPLPVVFAEAKANSVTEGSPDWPATMEPDQALEAKAIYERDGALRVQLVNLTITTLKNLSDDPKSISTKAPTLTPIEAVAYE